MLQLVGLVMSLSANKSSSSEYAKLMHCCRLVGVACLTVLSNNASVVQVANYTSSFLIDLCHAPMVIYTVM